jgi:hypothetical protein
MVQMKTGRQFKCRRVDNAGRLYLHGYSAAFIGQQPADNVGQPPRMSAEYVSATITSTAAHPTVSERLLLASNTHVTATSDERLTRQSRRCLLPAESVGRTLRLLNLLLLVILLGPCLASGTDGGQRYLYDGQSVQLIPGDTKSPPACKSFCGFPDYRISKVFNGSVLPPFQAMVFVLQ